MSVFQYFFDIKCLSINREKRCPECTGRSTTVVFVRRVPSSSLSSYAIVRDLRRRKDKMSKYFWNRVYLTRPAVLSRKENELFCPAPHAKLRCLLYSLPRGTSSSSYATAQSAGQPMLPCPAAPKVYSTRGIYRRTRLPAFNVYRCRRRIYPHKRIL